MKTSILIFEKISTNKIYAGVHWAKRKQWAENYQLACLPLKGITMASYPVAVTYIFHWQKKLLDCSNTTFLVKVIEDGLVTNGVLKDDTPEYVQSIFIESKRGEVDYVEIEIKSL